MSSRTDGSYVVTQEIAASVLSIVERENISLKSALGQVTNGFDYKIRGSIHAYVFETMKRLNAIDFFLEKSLKNKNLHEIDSFTRNLLRIAVYEMKFKGVHPALATDSAVRIAKKRGRNIKLVNAVLRKAETVSLEFSNFEKIKMLSLKYFHPEWFVKYCIDLLGKKDAFKLMEANIRLQPIYIRVNELRSSINSVVRYLESNNVEIEETFLPEVFEVISYQKHPAVLDWHRWGKYVIQDLASCYVSHVLDPQPDERIIDLAAATGIKTSHIAMLMQNSGKIFAIDNSRKRLMRMKNKLKTLGVLNVELILGDGCSISLNADKALVDAPCSSTGSYWMHPNVKWTFDKKKFKKTLKIQQKMLRNALSLTNEVVYSTCSIMFEENELNLIKVLCKVLKLKSPFSYGIRKFRGYHFKFWNRVIRSYPHLHNTSGFFIAKLAML